MQRHSKNILFNVCRKLIITAEIAQNLFDFWDSVLVTIGGAYSAPQTPMANEGGALAV